MKAVENRNAVGALRDGPFEERFSVGGFVCEGRFNQGRKIGEWKYCLKNGNLKAAGANHDDRISGVWKWYRENGELTQTGQSYDAERRTGVCRHYHPSGALTDESTFEADKKAGLSKTYDTTGKLLKEQRVARK